MFGLDPTTLALALASGALVGLFLSAFGGGGSVLAAPLLVYVVGVQDPHVAIGTSAASVAATALISLIGHARAHNVKWPCASVFALSGLAGSLAGSSVAKLVDGQALLLAFAFAMAAIALSMFRQREFAGNPDVRLTPAFMMRLVPLGLLVGFAAGFFGIGGGFLIVPGLLYATGMTIGAAMASSLVSVTIFGAATSSNYALSGYVDLRLAAILVVGGFLGGLIGHQLAKYLASRALFARRVFAAFILVVAAYVAIQAGLALAA
ncbi:MAG: sulfite exporter TauE/SafE family protein [Alphaproteobacteria bacterium]|nr:sulfite exporter TauE/SafE family protein [Alphaproteobacteria bacterium]|tara:strand:+ start:128 stop:919 length:792 start_codon:yes stop_codon:yes gene_type:complete